MLRTCQTDISVIVPIHNGTKWINRCFQSILQQDVLKDNVSLEVSICNDASSDDTASFLFLWKDIFTANQIKVVISDVKGSCPKGVGFAKNVAVRQSTGPYLCFQDIDDVMLPSRISQQYDTAKTRHNHIIGCQIERDPPGSTKRFTDWANKIPQDKLTTHIYTSNGPTVIMPTWFCHRSVFDRVGGFSESGKGTPEDLIFFFDHINLAGDVFRVNTVLLSYTYHGDATTLSVLSNTIWQLRIKQLESQVLRNWNSFSVWNAGKQGRRFVRSLSAQNQNKIMALHDVDSNKIGNVYEMYCSIRKAVILTIPILHFSEAKPPLVICMKMDLTRGEFERNLESLKLVEGRDYIMFS